MPYCLKVIEEQNTGDTACSPLDYFNFERDFSYLNICVNFPADLEFNENDVVIIGGGGMLNLIQHISPLDFVLTNTYHGAYWSQLMGKKTIVVKPFSTRFDNLPLNSLVINDLNAYTLSKIIEEANLKSFADENLLHNCRQLNIDFFERVQRSIIKI